MYLCAQYLRVGALEAEAMSLYRHRGRELWWIFQLVDSAVERAINRIDSEIGAGHGHRVGACMNVYMNVCIYMFICVSVMMRGNQRYRL